MYAGNYGFPNGAAGSPYNGAPPPGPQNTPLQPGSSGPNQQMMYNQQFPMGAQGGAGFHGNPNMMPGTGPAGMMQNPGVPHMAAANGQMPIYQTPYSNSPYGAGVPSSVAPPMNTPQNYAMAGGMPSSGFPMQQGMNPQQQQHMMQQGMQPHPSNAGGVTNSTPQRNFQGQSAQSTPTPTNTQPNQQPQFPTPQNALGTRQSQTPDNAHQQAHQQPPPNNIQTPQTPTFPSSVQGNTANGTSSASTPLSPGTDSKDKDRLAVILEINNELLVEAMQIQSTQQIIKKERATSNGSDGAASETEKKSKEEDDILAQDYFQLQTNLSYLATLADKKGQVVAPCPAYLTAPPLNTNVQLRQMQGPDGSENKLEVPNRSETAKYLQELYQKLQGLYPGIDPTKEPLFTAPPGRPGQAPNASKPGSQTPGHASPVPGRKKTPKLESSGPPPTSTSGVTAP